MSDAPINPPKLDAPDLPHMKDGRLVMGLTGWMDGGDVSTGSIQHLVKLLNAERAGRLDADECYVYQQINTDSGGDVSITRPRVNIVDGLIESIDMPRNDLHVDAANRVLLFEGHEPNLAWRHWTDCVFDLAHRAGVSTIVFVGSVGAAVPHTREPRVLSTMSDVALKDELEPLGVTFTSYQGPCSVMTYLMSRVAKGDCNGLRIASLIAEVPIYIHGPNPKSTEAALRKLSALLKLNLDLSELRGVTDEWERRVNQHVEASEKMSIYVRKLEEEYDSQVFDTQMGELKDWLEEKGIRLD